jgi:hypothetical protein
MLVVGLDYAVVQSLQNSSFKLDESTERKADGVLMRSVVSVECEQKSRDNDEGRQKTAGNYPATLRFGWCWARVDRRPVVKTP